MKDLAKGLEKLHGICDKGYAEAGKVTSLIMFLEVLKGESNICIVYNGSKRGLNWFCSDFITKCQN